MEASDKNTRSRVMAAMSFASLKTKLAGISEFQRYVQFFLFFFFLASACSFFFYREWEATLSVRLASVEFEDELPMNFDAEGELRPISSADATLVSSGKLDRVLAKTGDKVTKGQILAVTNESDNRNLLVAALTKFKQEAAAFAQGKRQYQRGAIDQKQFQSAEHQYEKSRRDLQSAQDTVQESLVRSPTDGSFRVTAQPGAALPAGGKIGEVEDLSKFFVSLSLPEAKAKDIPSRIPILLSLRRSNGEDGPPADPLRITAEVHYASGKGALSSGERSLKVVLPAAEVPPQWLHQNLNVSFVMRPLKHVALVDPGAVVTTQRESKIAVMSPSGALHWLKVTNAPRVNTKIVIKGVSPKTFRVVLPDKIERLNEAIAGNVRART